MTWFWYILYIIIAILILIGITYYLNKLGVGNVQRFIIIIVIIILELLFGVIIYNNGGIVNLGIGYPPAANICPDYWEYGNNLCLIPYNNRNIGTFKADNTTTPPGYNSKYNGIDFNDPGWSSVATNAFCSKQKWANMNNIWWDGITNIDNQC